MLEIYRRRSQCAIYYDLERKTIARIPTASNLKARGSDNNLFLGVNTDQDFCKILCKMFGVKNIDNITGLKFTMSSNFTDDSIDIQLNINHQGQIQIKFFKDGLLRQLENNYEFLSNGEINPEEILIVVDFDKKDIHFKNIKDFQL